MDPWRPVEEGEQERPEIDRVVLRDMLIDSLEEGIVKWGKQVLGVTEDERTKGKFNISFADGSMEQDIDLLVGADGAWSKVCNSSELLFPYSDIFGRFKCLGSSETFKPPEYVRIRK